MTPCALSAAGKTEQTEMGGEENRRKRTRRGISPKIKEMDLDKKGRLCLFPISKPVEWLFFFLLSASSMFNRAEEMLGDVRAEKKHSRPVWSDSFTYSFLEVVASLTEEARGGWRAANASEREAREVKAVNSAVNRVTLSNTCRWVKAAERCEIKAG